MGKSILKLEASAGSGKTYRLALEYIGRLLQMFAVLDKKPENFKERQKALGSKICVPGLEMTVFCSSFNTCRGS